MDKTIHAHKRWMSSLENAVKCDGWGQVIEAVEEYEKLANRMTSEHSNLELNTHQRNIVEKIIMTLNLRAKCLSSILDVDRPTLDDMKEVLPALLNLFSDESMVYPIDLSVFSAEDIESVSQSNPSVLHHDDDDDVMLQLNNGLLQKAPMPTASNSYLMVRISKIGLKDSEEYIDPHVTISVFDNIGISLEEPQETAISKTKRPPYIHFDVDVHIQTPLEKLHEENASIFFEFMHYISIPTISVC